MTFSRPAPLWPIFSICCLALTACPESGPDVRPHDMGHSDASDAGGDVSVGALALNSVMPSSGPQAGGTVVTLSGSGFAEGLSVRFGSAVATAVQVADEGTATATTPPAANPGTVRVAVELGGDGASISDAFTYLPGDTPPGSVDWCQLQAQSPVTVTAGDDTPLLFALVFAEGRTSGAGPGTGIEAELGFGAGDDPAGFEYVAATFNEDKDGLTPGDLANDEWGAALNIAVPGTYKYSMRFRLDGGDWSYCDLDGTENGVTADQLGVIEVNEPLVPTVTSCNVQFPQVVSDGAVGTPVEFFGRVVVPGVTGSGADSGQIQAQLLIGPVGSDPNASAAFDVFAASYNPSPIGIGPDQDEYMASFDPPATGEYAAFYGFSTDGGSSWTYCDIDPAPSFDATNGGWMLVGQSAEVVDFCHVWQDTLTVGAGDSAPLVTVEVFDDPTTVGNGGANQAMIEAQAGFGARYSNPATSGWMWSTALPFKGTRPGVDNNYEYEGAAFADADRPGAGDYAVAVRARLNAGPWVYCDTDESNGGYFAPAATPMTVSN